MIMRMKQIILAILILGLSSCGVAPTASKFPIEKIDLGANKSNVKSLCGKPFRSDIFTKNHKKIEVLYYKEPARVRNTEFIITTALTFANDSLISITQNDKNISGIELSGDSIRRQ